MSTPRAKHAGGLFDRPGRLLAGAAILVLFSWYAFTASANWHELLVGAIATVITVLFFANVLHTERLNLNLRARDLALCWRLPSAILKDCWIITVVLVKDLLGIERAGSFYKACGFETSEHNPTLVGRSALAVVYTTMSPNMLVIGIDPARSLILFHQLRSAPVPEITRQLGARP